AFDRGIANHVLSSVAGRTRRSETVARGGHHRAAIAGEAVATWQTGGVVGFVLEVGRVEGERPVLIGVAEHGVEQRGRGRFQAVGAIPAGANVTHPGTGAEARNTGDAEAVLRPQRSHVLRYAGNALALLR